MKIKKRLLICDDEAGIRETLGSLLEDDFEMEFASDGDEAVKKVKEAKYNCVLLDIKLPGKDGLKILQEIKKISPKTKIIMISGYQCVETATKALQLGASDYLTKPFEIDELIAKIHKK